MQVNQIRSTFLDFFKSRDHEVVKSSPLIPHNDPTLMFTNAGMNQFKNYFTGIETPKFKTATSSQKCVRAGGKHNDLENVGFTARHHTFFEMMGNFSFGDYFKERAIEMAWECLTKEFGFNKDKMYITVYHDDVETFNIWKKITGFSDDRIIKIATKDNFWQMGDIGPCGPCTEIFYDLGDKVQGGLPGTPEQEGDRYMEIWNLVFMQYEDKADGSRVNLPNPCVDTGMGLERLAAVMQGKINNYDIDLFTALTDASKHYTKNSEGVFSHRVIADHLRSGSFLIADGVMPSNEGRGYVLRRILRRAIRHVYNLGCKEPILHRMVEDLSGQMGEAFPELRRAEAVIKSTLLLEEERFLKTIDNGMKLLDDSIDKVGSDKTLDGEVAFKLYDTYGFPLDLTEDILRTKELKLDNAGFDKAMKSQKEMARAAWQGSGEKAADTVWFEIKEEVGSTEFTGYTSTVGEGVVTAMIQDGKKVESASSGEAIVVLNQTPFYGESGGQIGDRGKLGGYDVIDTKKFASTVFGHFVKLEGKLSVGDAVQTSIDDKRRNKIRANHSATHILHKALKDVLGPQVNQKGSLVAPDRLRFDFSNPKGMTAEEVAKVEMLVNQEIIDNHNTETSIDTPEEAIKRGAMALFGEKYGDEVRIVQIGDSLELCGGTHVRRTGDIGMLKIVSEEAIASGVRRIEAVTGIEALEYVNVFENQMREIAGNLKSSVKDVAARVESLSNDKVTLQKELASLKLKMALSGSSEIEKIGNTQLLMKRLEGIPAGELKSALDVLKNNISSGVVALSAVFEDKVSLLVYVTKDQQGKISAGDIIKNIAPEIDGRGGGKPEMAQAGGTKISGIDAAFAKLKDMLEAK